MLFSLTVSRLERRVPLEGKDFTDVIQELRDQGVCWKQDTRSYYDLAQQFFSLRFYKATQLVEALSRDIRLIRPIAKLDPRGRINIKKEDVAPCIAASRDNLQYGNSNLPNLLGAAQAQSETSYGKLMGSLDHTDILRLVKQSSVKRRQLLPIGLPPTRNSSTNCRNSLPALFIRGKPGTSGRLTKARNPSHSILPWTTSRRGIFRGSECTIQCSGQCLSGMCDGEPSLHRFHCSSRRRPTRLFPSLQAR